MSKKAHHSNGATDAAAETDTTNNTSVEDKCSTAIVAVARNQILNLWAEPGCGKSDALGYVQELERQIEAAVGLGQLGSGKSDALEFPLRHLRTCIYLHER